MDQRNFGKVLLKGKCGWDGYVREKNHEVGKKAVGYNRIPNEVWEEWKEVLLQVYEKNNFF